MRRASILTCSVRGAACARRRLRGAQEEWAAARLRRARHFHRDETVRSGRLRQDPGSRRRDPKHARIAVAHRGQSQPASYLFGTMHSTDERVTQALARRRGGFQRRATPSRLNTSKAKSPLVQARRAGGREGLLPEGNGLKDLLTPAELATLRKTLGAEGLPANAVHLLRPWFAGLALALPVCEKKRSEAGLLPLDQRLERDAIAQGKRVVGLETAAFQIDALIGMPDAVQIKLLKGTVATLHLRNDALEVLHRAYLGRDLGTTLPFTKRLMERAGHDPSPIDTVESEIAVKRNYGMRDASLPLLEQGGAFIAVGALHLLGKEGLVELFRAAGYTVTPIE